MAIADNVITEADNMIYVEIPRISNCCCYFPLKLGSFVVGIYHEILGTMIVCSAIYNIDTDQVKNLENVLVVFTHYTGLVFSLLLGVCLVVTSGLLIAALFKDKHNYVPPFLIVKVLVMLMNVSGLIIFLIRTFSSFVTNALYVLFFFINGVFSFYCFVVVYSYYREATWNSTVS